MTSRTQKEIVIEHLLEFNAISRNWCLQRFITRLSALIYDLKKDGWSFKHENVDGNYIYYVVSKPEKFNNNKQQTLF